MKGLFIACQFVVSFVLCGAAPVARERVSELPEAKQNAWLDYLERSRAFALEDQLALDTEVAASGLAAALKAPSGSDFKLPDRLDEAWFASEEAQKLTDVVLSYQSPAGGWSKHVDYGAGARKPGMQWTSQSDPGKSPHYLATFDNRSTTEQLHLLARVWLATGRADCQRAFEKDLRYVLNARYPDSGWPQVYPLEGDYHDDITFNDDAMTHVLELLQAIVEGQPEYAFLSEKLRAESITAFEAGLRCVLATQVEQAGRRTVWCAQYDAITLEPSNARAMEPATLSGVESIRLLRFLMSIDRPSPDIVEAIESGLHWFEDAKITGLTRTKRDGKTVYEQNPDSTEVYWARFYDLDTGKPVFPGRDGILYESFDEMAKVNTVGYDYYSKLPASVLKNGQKKWRKTLGLAQGSD